MIADRSPSRKNELSSLLMPANGEANRSWRGIGVVRLAQPERMRLASTTKRAGRKALEDVPCVVKSETLSRWDRALVAKWLSSSAAYFGVAHSLVSSSPITLLRSTMMWPAAVEPNLTS